MLPVGYHVVVDVAAAAAVADICCVVQQQTCLRILIFAVFLIYEMFPWQSL